MAMTYVVKDLKELAEFFRKKAERLQRLGLGIEGHYTAKYRKVFISQAEIWLQAAAMVEATEIEGQLDSCGDSQ